MNHEQIYKDTITIVSGIVSGLYASGKTEVDLSKYLNETYETVKAFRQKYEEETNTSNNKSSSVQIVSGRKKTTRF